MRGVSAVTIISKEHQLSPLNHPIDRHRRYDTDQYSIVDEEHCPLLHNPAFNMPGMGSTYCEFPCRQKWKLISNRV